MFVNESSVSAEAMHVSLLSYSDIRFETASSLELLAGAPRTLLVHTSYGCGDPNGTLQLENDTRLASSGGAVLDYWGSELQIAATGTVNASASTLTISERCSATFSMAVGGTQTPGDGERYAMNIVQAELARLFAQSLVLDSFNGSIFVAGLEQSQHLSGVAHGKIEIVASSANGSHQSITFGDDATRFVGNDGGGVLIEGYHGITLNQNVTSSTSDALAFHFEAGSMTLAQDVVVQTTADAAQSDITFTSSSSDAQPLICNMPCEIGALDSASSVSLDTPLVLAREAAQHSTFHLFCRTHVFVPVQQRRHLDARYGELRRRVVA